MEAARSKGVSGVASQPCLLPAAPWPVSVFSKDRFGFAICQTSRPWRQGGCEAVDAPGREGRLWEIEGQGVGGLGVKEEEEDKEKKVEDAEKGRRGWKRQRRWEKKKCEVRGRARERIRIKEQEEYEENEEYNEKKK